MSFLLGKLREQINGIAKRAGFLPSAFLRHPLMLALDGCNLDEQQLKFFCQLRYNAVSGFELCLERALQLARNAGKVELAHELQENLDDERGQGRSAGQGAHATWRQDFLTALEINITPNPADSPRLYAFEESDDLATLCGILLAAEYTIPPEDTKALKSLRHGFPDIFTSDKDEGTVEQVRATRYLADHIKHDAQSHFPDLMKAMAKELAAEQEKISTGIERFAAERIMFYSYIAKQIGLDFRPLLDSSTAPQASQPYR